MHEQSGFVGACRKQTCHLEVLLKVSASMLFAVGWERAYITTAFPFRPLARFFVTGQRVKLPSSITSRLKKRPQPPALQKLPRKTPPRD